MRPKSINKRHRHADHKISVEQALERGSGKLMVLFNKPFGVLSQFTSEGGHQCLADYIDIKEVYPAGRLDKDSEGLLLLTNDGALQHAIAHPKKKLAKTYWVQVEGIASAMQLDQLKQGVLIKSGKTRPARVEVIDEPDLWPRNPPIRERKQIPTQWLAITLTEGKNRQVRRMTAAVGLPTLRLVRWSIGNWTVRDISPGNFQVMSLNS